MPASTATSERSIRGSVAARRGRSPRAGAACRAGPGPYHARNVRASRCRRARLSRVAIFTDSASDLDPGRGGRRGDRDRPAPRQLRDRDLQGRRRPVDRGVLGADGRARMRRSRRPPPRRPASSRRPTRRPSRPAPTPSSRSTSPARCRGRSRAPRSPATCCPTARSTSSIRSGASMAQGILRPDGRRARRRGACRPRRSPRSSRRGRPTCGMYVALETLEYLKKGGRISGAQAAIGTLLSVKPIIARQARRRRDGDRVRTRSKARERLHRADLPSDRSSGSRSCTRSAPDVEAFRDEVVARAPRARRRRTSTIDLVGAVGRAAPRPGLRRRGGPVSEPDRPRRRPDERTLRQGCDNVADRYHRAGVSDELSAILAAT